MKKIIHGLLVAMLGVSAAQAKVHHDQTFLMARDSISNNLVAAAMTPKNSKKGLGARVGVTGYYRKSHNKAELAHYFGSGTNNAQTKPHGKFEVAKTSESDTTGGQSGLYVDHIPTDAAGEFAMRGDAVLNPERVEYGAHISWAQNLSSLVDGLWLSVDTPVVKTESTMGLTVANGVANAAVNDGEVGYTVDKYFGGVKPTKALGAAQDALVANKADNKKHSTTQLADVAVRVGYNFLSDKDYTVGLAATATIPAGNNPTGEWLFEPVAGIGGFTVGAGLNADVNLWRSKDSKSSVDVRVSGTYRYSLENTQKRVLGVFNHVTGKIVTMAPYMNVGVAGKTGVRPAANQLLRDVKVEGKGMFDLVAGLNGVYNGFSFGAHYNMFAAQEESVKLSNAWKDNTVGYALETYDASAASVVGSAADTFGGPIQSEGTTTGLTSAGAALAGNNTARYYINSKAAATPSQLTHKVAGTLGYCFCMATPVTVSLVGEYEFDSNDNSSVASWMIGGKVGICF